jgi:hypothetical protein
MGASGSLGCQQWLSPMGYAYLYGYVPGIVPSQGLKLSAMTQLKLSDKSVFGQPAVNVMPRGMADNTALLQQLSITNNLLTKVTADYAIPVNFSLFCRPTSQRVCKYLQFQGCEARKNAV